MYDFDLTLGANRIRMWTPGGPNGVGHIWFGQSHNHADYELHVMLEGSATVDVEGKVCQVGEGDLILIAPGRYHCRLPEDGAISRMCVNFTVTQGPWVRALSEKVPDCAIFPAGEEILTAARSIERELKEPQPMYRTMLYSHLCRILVSLLRGFELSETGEEITPAKKTDLLHTYKVDLFFEEHLKQGARVEDLAEHLFLSKSQLNRLLRETYGMTFREKLLRARMGQAARLLRHTDMTVYQIAEEVGYSLPSSFYHVFRTWYGMTPEQYRAANQIK